MAGWRTNSLKLRGGVAVAAAAMLALSACGGGDDAFDSGSAEPSASAGGGSKALTVGGATFTEMAIMQQMYGQLLAKAGYTVTYKTAASREIYSKSLVSGEIDVVPEYAATLAEFLNREENGAEAKSVSTADAASTVTALKPLAEAQGLTVLQPAEASNRNAFAVTKKTADSTGATTLSQFAAKKPSINLAGTEDCGNPERVFCKPGLEKVYGFKVKIDPFDFGSTQAKQAVITGKDDMVLTGTTDGTLDQLGLVILEDDKKLQAADNLVPVVNTESAGAADIAEALNKLAPVLTTDDLAALNLAVEGERKKPEEVAAEYLKEKGLA